MLRWAFGFFIIAIASGLIGFTGLAFDIIKIAQVVFFVSLVLCIGLLIIHFVRKEPPLPPI